MRLILRWILNAGVLLLIAYYVPNIALAGLYSALVTAFVLGLINAIIRPILLLLTLPVNLITLGLFTFVVNALLFWFVSTVVEGFLVVGFQAAFVGAFIMTIASWFIGHVLKRK